MKEVPMQHQLRSTLATTTNPLVLVLVTWALLWGGGAGHAPLPDVGPGPGAGSGGSLADIRAVDGDVVWAESYSQRFPGCVALALWPAGERPVAVVTRGADGEVSRLELAALGHGEGPVIGACR